MGEVWRAEHQSLVRPAAIKLIQPEVLGFDNSKEAAGAQRRFERETQATAMLSSPHTIHLYDFRNRGQWRVLLRHGTPSRRRPANSCGEVWARAC